MSARGEPGTWRYLAFWEPGGDIDLPATLAEMPCDDMHAAGLLTAERPGWLHYAAIAGRWHVWDGRCHAPDPADLIGKTVAGWAERAEKALDKARQSVGAIVSLDNPGAEGKDLKAAVAAEWKKWEPAERYAAGLRRSAGKASLERYLATACAVPDGELDERNPELVSTASGTVSLRTGQVRPHDPADMITHCLPDAYVPGAPCPRFLGVLHTVCGGKADVAWYLLKLLGYAMLGDNREQRVVFISGPTGNGKSTLLHVVSSVLGPLAHESQAALITVTRHGRNARTENSIRGARLITITETSEWMHIEEAQLKRLTGERVISVDQHYAKTELRTPVTWLIVIATNQMPGLTNFDEALRRRIIVIPGGPSVPAHLVDTLLADKILAEEREGVLALLIAAAREYFRAGLGDVPLEVQVTTDGYAAEQDTVAQFLADCCLLSPSLNGHVPPHVPMNGAWRGYCAWSQGGPRLGRNEFYTRLASQAGVSRNDVSRRFEGITWDPQKATELGVWQET